MVPAPDRREGALRHPESHPPKTHRTVHSRTPAERPLPLYALIGICSVGYIKRVESVFEVIAEPNRRAILSLLLDRHRALLFTDEVHRLRATPPAAGGGGIHPPRLPRLLPRGALVGQVPRRGADACARAGAAQGMGLRRLRHQPGLRAHRPPLRGRCPAAWGPAAATCVLWGLSYFFWRRLQAAPASV